MVLRGVHGFSSVAAASRVGQEKQVPRRADLSFAACLCFCLSGVCRLPASQDVVETEHVNTRCRSGNPWRSRQEECSPEKTAQRDAPVAPRYTLPRRKTVRKTEDETCHPRPTPAWPIGSPKTHSRSPRGHANAMQLQSGNMGASSPRSCRPIASLSPHTHEPLILEARGGKCI